MNRLARLIVLALSFSASISAQQQFPTLEKGFQPEKLYHFGDIDSVSVFSGTLLVNLPIGPEYALNGGMSYQLRLSYNSKPWDLLQEGPFVHAIPSRRSSAGMGWILGMGRYIPPDDPANQSFTDVYEAPDGGDHRFDGTSPDSCTSACPAYTSDGSTLRLRAVSSTVREIDFPDGVTKKFIKASGVWNLREIRNAKNTDIVTITPGTGHLSQCSSSSTSYWSISDSLGRGHTLCFKNLTVDSVARPMVDRVVLAAPGGSATYVFDYLSLTTSKPLEDTDFGNSWRQTHDVQLLQTLTLPDSSTYRFAVGGGDFIGTIVLPTLGKIEYQYTSWMVPSTELCANTYGLSFGFGAIGRGVAIRTFTPSVPAGQTAVSRTWTYTRQLGPTIGYTSSQYCVVETGPGVPPESFHVELYDELIVTVTDPLGHKVASHFSVWPGQDYGRLPDPDTSPAGFKRAYYGYPYGRYDAAQDRYLSQEIFDCTGACTLQRSIWVRHEPGPRLYSDPPMPNRLVSQRTIFHDDPAGCVGEGSDPTCSRTSTNFDDWDGYGHYRQASSTIRFDNDAVMRTVTTAWNKQAGVARTIAADKPWVLNTYESVRTTENSVTAVQQTCFDPDSGFLRGTRTLVGLTPAATDLLAVYEEENADGNTTQEKYYGGDHTPLTANQSVLCDAVDALANTTPAYRIHHQWQNGYPHRSWFEGFPFFFRDLTIDLNGVITASRDPAGLETTFSYDTSWRLASVTPPGLATTSYVYANATDSGGHLTQPASVVETTPSTDAGERKREYQYDTFGRLWRDKTLMPDGTWSLRETLYDGLDRVASVSMPVTLPTGVTELTFTPPYKTTHAYDSAGRPSAVTAPDGSATTFAYAGARQQTRTASIATGVTETDVGTTETYDAQGRLVTVTDVPGSSPAVTTTYGYDIGNRLKSVSMVADGLTQTRAFTYDKRGLLKSEQHPELGTNGYGTTSWTDYDARGHARRKTTGDLVDLKFEYDDAERLTAVRDRTAGEQLLKQFAWDCIPGACPNALLQGRLAASARWNYDPVLGTVAITEAYQYHPTTGQMVRRDQAIGSASEFAGESFFFTQSYNDLGDVFTVNYPCRSRATTNGCLDNLDPRQVRNTYQNAFLTRIGTPSVTDLWASNVTYQPNGSIGTITHGKGATAVQETWVADAHGMPRPAAIRGTNATGTIELWSSGDYLYDGSGNVKRIGSTYYAYDPLGRLSTWGSLPTAMIGEWNTLLIDGFGNRRAASQKSCGMFGTKLLCAQPTYVPWEMNGTTNHYVSMTYDDAGNVLRDFGQRDFTWDPLGMMTGTTVDNRTFRYLYAADDERIAAVERVPAGAATRNRTTFTIRGLNARQLAVWTDDRTSGSSIFTWKEDTIWRGAQLLARAHTTGTMDYTLDHLGSPRLITNDATGQTLDQQNFAPFGEGGLYGSGALQFTAHERDRANLGGGTYDLPDYMHARYYDVGVGRFLSVDPVIDVKAAMSNSQMWNRYAYVGNNPLNLVDPNGRQAKRACDPGMQCGVAALVQQAMKDDFEADWNEGAEAARVLTPGTISSRQELEAAQWTMTELAIKYVLPFVIPGEGTAVNLAENAAKGEVLAALRAGEGTMTSAQRAAVIRQVGRATTSESVSVLQNTNGTVNILRTRPGADGSQTFVTQVGRAGNTQTVQTAQNAAGQQVHYDPKGGTSLWKAIRDWFQ